MVSQTYLFLCPPRNEPPPNISLSCFSGDFGLSGSKGFCQAQNGRQDRYPYVWGGVGAITDASPDTHVWSGKMQFSQSYWYCPARFCNAHWALERGESVTGSSMTGGVHACGHWHRALSTPTCGIGRGRAGTNLEPNIPHSTLCVHISTRARPRLAPSAPCLMAWIFLLNWLQKKNVECAASWPKIVWPLLGDLHRTMVFLTTGRNRSQDRIKKKTDSRSYL